MNGNDIASITEAEAAYNAAAERVAQAETERAATMADYAAAVAAVIGLGVGDRVICDGLEFEVRRFETALRVTEGEFAVSVYGSKITKNGAPSKNVQYLPRLAFTDDRPSGITKIEAQ